MHSVGINMQYKQVQSISITIFEEVILLVVFVDYTIICHFSFRKIDGMYVCVRSGPISEKYRKRPETATNELSPPPAPAVTDHDHRTPSPVLRSSPPLVDAHHAVLYQQDPPLQTHSSPPHHTGVEHMGSHQSYHSETIAMATHTFPQMTHPSSAPSTNFPPPIGFQQTYNPATQPPGYPPTANMQGYPTPGYQYGNVGVAPMMGGVPVGNMRGAIPPYPVSVCAKVRTYIYMHEIPQ